jgi:hypothetical protein
MAASQECDMGISRAKIAILLLPLLNAVFHVPAFGQTDFSGEWFPLAHEDREVDRRGGAAIGDYTGLPINDAARLRADNYDAAVFTLPEWQCRPHGVDFIPLGLSELRIWKEIDPVTQQFVAWRMHWLRSASDRAIYMDERPHPPEYAAHTWEGFSTGKWEGNMLRITTTHMKEDYLRRNGVSRSSFATLSELLFLHGDYLTWTTIIYDPAYLTEPMIRNASYIRVPHQQMPAYPCPVVVEVVRAKGSVPHHLPGKNPYLTEFAEKAGIPFEVTRGGAETIYPEYQLKLNRILRAAPK